MLARAHHWTVTQAKGFESTSSCTLHVTFILILSSHVYLRLLRDFLPSALQTTNVWACRCVPKHTVCPAGFLFKARSQNCEKWLLIFVMSVCLSIRPSVLIEQLGFRRTDIRNIWYLSIFRNSVEKIQVWIKSDNNNYQCTWRPTYIFNHNSLSSS